MQFLKVITIELITNSHRFKNVCIITYFHFSYNFLIILCLRCCLLNVLIYFSANYINKRINNKIEKNHVISISLQVLFNFIIFK